MTDNHFDKIADDYNAMLAEQLTFFGEETAYFAEYKIIKLKSLLRKEPVSILDFGCGIGRSTFYLRHYFPQADLYGSDPSLKSLIKAKEHVPTAHFLSTDELKKISHPFDVIFIANVFHHIAPKDRLTTLQFIKDISAPGARIVIFEHNPYNPVTRHLVNTCAFDHDAILLKPKELITLFNQIGISTMRLEYTLFFPAIFKRLRFLEKYLNYLPLGGQYVLCATR